MSAWVQNLRWLREWNYAFSCCIAEVRVLCIIESAYKSFNFTVAVSGTQKFSNKITPVLGLPRCDAIGSVAVLAAWLR